MVVQDFSELVNGVAAKVNAIIDETKDTTPSFLSTSIFDVVNDPEDLIYRTQGVVGLSYLEGKDEQGNLKTDKTYPSYQTEYVMKEKGKIVTISQMLIKTRPKELEAKLSETKQLFIAAQRTLKKHAWQVLVNGFSTTDISSNLPISRLGDAVAMYSASHPSRVPGVAVRSNLLAGNPAFSATSAELAMRQIREQLNGRGLEIGYEGEYLFVLPPSLTKLGKETFMSEKAPDTANNDINYYKGITDFVSVVYLGTAASGQTNGDTAFFCFAKNVPDGERSLKYVSLIAPKLETAANFDSKEIKNSIDGAWAMGYSTFEYTSGSNGSNA